MNFDVSGEPANSPQLPPLTEEQQLLQRLAAGEMNAFWHLWQWHQDYLKNCCLQWTNSNLTAAEDLLSQAMLKAWEKAQKYAGKIDNFKSWVTTLTRNFWLDLKRRPWTNQVEDIEVYAEQEDLEWFAVDDTPESALERDDKNRVIRAAIDELPIKMRETFILHFYEELSHQEIVERQRISYANVCKRISQAREILRVELRSYFIGDADTKSDTTKVAAKPVKSQKARKKVAKVEAVLPETEQFDSSVNKKLEAIESNGEADPTSDLIQDRGASIAPLPIPGLGDKFGQDKSLFHVGAQSDRLQVLRPQVLRPQVLRLQLPIPFLGHKLDRDKSLFYVCQGASIAPLPIPGLGDKFAQDKLLFHVGAQCLRRQSLRLQSLRLQLIILLPSIIRENENQTTRMRRAQTALPGRKHCAPTNTLMSFPHPKSVIPAKAGIHFLLDKYLARAHWGRPYQYPTFIETFLLGQTPAKSSTSFSLTALI